ncbi:MAG: ABC transporter ATP-binding protein [Deltaproteobacteria bacterium]|nr:MAG: ABC transporter ATP-binding protein [Deltaproteobacteria bacterium]
MTSTAPEASPSPDTAARPAAEDVLIEVRDVSRIYTQGQLEVRALDRVSVTFAPGEFTAIAGPSGSGKTTLLNVIGALDKPSAGSVIVDGREVAQLGRAEGADFRLRHVGFVFQAYNLLPVLTAYENAEFTLALQGLPKTERRERVMPLLERVGLGQKADRRPDELSGGEQQRVAVVRALASKPNLVLADEPTANLDRKTGEALLDLMLELQREHGITFLFSTHDPLVMERARRILRMDSGRIVADERQGEA